MRLIFASLIIFSFMFECSIQAQEPLLRHFTVKDGLPGGMVYMCMQDSKGYIWSATERGVTRFDGHQFKLFSIKDGLPCNDVWKIIEDKVGRIWVNTFSGICYIKDDKVIELNNISFPERVEKVRHHFCELGHLILLPNSNQIYVLNEMDSLVFKKGFKGPSYMNLGLILEEKNAIPMFKEYRNSLGMNEGDLLSLVNESVLIDKRLEIEKEFPNFFSEIEAFMTISQGRVIVVMRSGGLYEMTKNGAQAIDLAYLKNEIV